MKGSGKSTYPRDHYRSSQNYAPKTPPRGNGRWKANWSPKTEARAEGLEVRYYSHKDRVTVKVGLRRHELLLLVVVLIAVIVSLVATGAGNVNKAGLVCLLRSWAGV
jgi:hypothetical protein